MFDGAQDDWMLGDPLDDTAMRWARRGLVALAAGLVLGLAASAFAQVQQPNVVGSQYLSTPQAVANQQTVPFRVDNDGTLHVTSTVASGTVQPIAGTTGGATPYFVQPTASDNHAVIKNGAGTAYGIMATNNSVTINYLRLYNAGTGFNGCNSATGLLTQVAILPSGGITVAFPVGMAFATGLSICVTSGYATNDTTNATASAMSVTVLYN